MNLNFDHTTSNCLNTRSQHPILDIHFPEGGQKRARKVVTRSRARATGKFPSRKMGRMMQWESVNELNAFRLLEANPWVLAFHEQPAEITYLLHGERCRHTPDILVSNKEGKEFWEVKASANARRPEVMERTSLLTARLPDHGYQYKMILGEDLARQPRLMNLKQILKGNGAIITPLIRERIRQFFIRTSEISLFDLISAIGENIGKQEIYRLIIEGVLIGNLDQQLSEGSMLRHTEISNLNNSGGIQL